MIELNTTITALKNSIEVSNNRLDQSNIKISELKDRQVGIIQSEKQKEKGMKKVKTAYRIYGSP